jgi:hypothetical protein
MNYFTSTAYLVTATISGRHGNYGSTTSIIGVFNTKQRAESAMLEFKDKYNKGQQRGCGLSKSDIEILEIKPCVIDEKIISKVYE